jgi:hypothetical protein
MMAYLMVKSLMLENLLGVSLSVMDLLGVFQQAAFPKSEYLLALQHRCHLQALYRTDPRTGPNNTAQLHHPTAKQNY